MMMVMVMVMVMVTLMVMVMVMKLVMVMVLVLVTVMAVNEKFQSLELFPTFLTKLREVCYLHINNSDEQYKRVKPMTELRGKFHRNYDLTAADCLVFPVHKPGHWIIIIADIQHKQVL